MNNNDEKEGYEDDPYSYLDDRPEMSPAAFLWGMGAIFVIVCGCLIAAIF